MAARVCHSVCKLATIMMLLVLASAENPKANCTLASTKKQVHAFYYLWYGTPRHDGKWLHWNHEVLPHWTSSVNERFGDQIGKKFQPPNNIHSVFYPQEGPYSSSDEAVIERHLHQMIDAGIDTVVMSWWGKPDRAGATDTQGVSTDAMVANLLFVANKLQLSLSGRINFAFHLEPYPGRSAQSILEDLMHISDEYSKKYNHLIAHICGRPLVYIYDSYHVSINDWLKLLDESGELTIRGSQYDIFAIGLWLDRHHGQELQIAGFDGIYTYFATDGFSYGSSTMNWKYLVSYCNKNRMWCSLSVGPGYDDSKIRPWNTHHKRDRRGDIYYGDMWTRAIAANPPIISITSFNEWGEGTQIEPAASTQAAISAAIQKYYDQDGMDSMSNHEAVGAGGPPKRYAYYHPDADIYLRESQRHSREFRKKETPDSSAVGVIQDVLKGEL